MVAVGGEAKKKRVRMHVRKKRRGGQGKRPQPLAEKLLAQYRSAAQVQPLADLPGWSAGTGRVALRVVKEEVEHYSSYSDSDYAHPAIGGVAAPEVSIPAVRGDALCVSDSNSESDYDAHWRQRRQSPPSAKKAVMVLAELLQHQWS